MVKLRDEGQKSFLNSFGVDTLSADSNVDYLVVFTNVITKKQTFDSAWIQV